MSEHEINQGGPAPALARAATPLPMGLPMPLKTGAPAAPTIVITGDSSRPVNETAEPPARAPVVIISSSAPPRMTPSGAAAARPTTVGSEAHGPFAASDTASASSPFRVGPYEVATRIARGGIGSVYVCRRAGGGDAGRLFTLKVVREHVQQDLAAASFRHEAKIGAAFRHQHAQTVVDSGIYEGQPFLIFDYLEGCTLADLLVDETRPPPGVSVSIVLDVLGALQALHHATDARGKPLGLTHCDISPENVLVGVNGVARLADFGSARFTSTGEGPQPFALSKPPYMSPEQFRGESLDARSDIFSVGVLLWTALTGKPLFAGDSYDETVMNVMRKKIKLPSAVGGPPCLDDICMQALSRSPDGRFVIAAAMGTALRTAATAQNLVESREGVGAWVRRTMGDELAERRRNIDAMFNGQRVAPAAPAPESLGSTSAMRAFTRAAPGSEAAKPAPTPTPPAGDKSLGARTIFRPAPGAGRRPRLTLQQQAVIAVASALAFAATIGVGLAFTMRPSRVVPAAAAARERPAAMLVSPGGYPQTAALRPPTVPPL
jgi:serine/threonine protein kinase